MYRPGSKGDCDAPTVSSAVYSACHGRSSCVVVADPSWIQSNPCPTSKKYLQVWYTCIRNSTMQPYESLNSKFTYNFNRNKVFYGRSENGFLTKIPKPTIYEEKYLNREYPISATFEEFVSYLVDPDNVDVTDDVIDHGQRNVKATNVRHWQSYHTLAYPCHIDYDIIGHIETIEEDARYVLHQIEAPPTLKYPNGLDKQSGKTTTQNIKDKFLRSLNKTLLSKLTDMYSIDYKLFGYKIPQFV